MRARRPADAAMIQFDPYSIVVDFYEEWARPQKDDIPFYVKHATSVRGPVVELGVGLSDAMLTEAARRAAAEDVAEKITFVEADMRTFVADPAVELVIIPFR